MVISADIFVVLLRYFKNFIENLIIISITVSQPSECLKFMIFREGCFFMHVECMYLSEALENFCHHQFYKSR